MADVVAVCGSVAAMYAGHRQSFDHDHVLRDLAGRYEQVLEAAEATEGWATSVRASKPPFTIMGKLGGIEAGLRQLDEFYTDRSEEAGSVLTALVAHLAEPQPADPAVIDELSRYKGLDPRWHNWADVVAVCEELALRLAGATS